MMRPAVMKAIFLATMLCALILSPAHAEVRILASPGGQVGPFLELFERVRASGERVVIDGPCLSACTLVLSVVPDDRICVTRRAVLGFHAAIAVDRYGRRYSASAATRVIAGLDWPAWRTLSKSSIAPRARTHCNVSVMCLVDRRR